MKELRFDEIIVGNWTTPGQDTINSTLYGLSSDGIVYKYISSRRGWEKLGMEEVE